MPRGPFRRRREGDARRVDERVARRRLHRADRSALHDPHHQLVVAASVVLLVLGTVGAAYSPLFGVERVRV
ncbi:MAG: hypothetical protein EOO67_11815, partial [Microbacterium sp.]